MAHAPDWQRSVVSIAIALERNARATPITQEDLFGGPLQLASSAYANYYAELARCVCARELRQQVVA